MDEIPQCEHFSSENWKGLTWISQHRHLLPSPGVKITKNPIIVRLLGAAESTPLHKCITRFEESV
jgi:hypothetical protein